jgi:hypothetical protein
MTDSSWAALHLWRWYRGDPMRAFRQSKHGRALHELGRKTFITIGDFPRIYARRNVALTSYMTILHYPCKMRCRWNF